MVDFAGRVGPLNPEFVVGHRCRANMAHIRQSRPDSGLVFHIKVFNSYRVVSSLLGSGFSELRDRGWPIFFFFFTLVTGPRRSLSLKLSDTRVYEPQTRARLDTTTHFCGVVVLKLTVGQSETPLLCRRGFARAPNVHRAESLNSEHFALSTSHKTRITTQ